MAERKIGGRSFRTTPILATKAIVLQAKLFRVLGPAMTHLGEIMGGYGKDKSEEEKAQSNVAAIAAFADIFAATPPEEIGSLVQEVIEIAEIRGEGGEYRQCDFDGDFTGKQGDVIPVVTFVLQEQFGDFFSGLPGIGSQNASGRA